VWSDGGKNKTIMPGSRFHLMDNAAAALWCRELVRKSAECRDRLHGLLFKPIFRSASVFGETKVADIETGRARSPESLFLHRSIGITAPLRPTSHKHFDFRITGQLQGKSLDRGSSTGLSVTHRSLGWHYSPLAEKLLQLRFRFEATIFGDEFFPFQMSRAGNAPMTEFTDAAGIDEFDRW
jgi:hypothetical protein